MSAIQLKNVSFGYHKNQLVLSNINITVPQGSIYGFLGANGAGKTTSIRLMLGLMKPLKGKVSVFNNAIKDSYPKYLNRIGSLIESPSLYGHLSAKDNLRIWSKYFKVPKNRIDEVLELVSLTDAKKKKVQAFSTGMKQRLGLATAMLHNPDLLILDEPTNGLDPMGIIELREILHRLKEAGKTILLSSHILSEVEKIVSNLGIIKDGSIVFEGSLDELQALRQQNLEVILRVSDVNKALAIIPVARKNKEEQGRIKLVVEQEHELPQIIKQLVNNGIDIYEVRPKAKNLETLFLSFANENNHKNNNKNA